MIRKSTQLDIQNIESIYNHVHDCEEQGLLSTGWIRNIYPTRKTTTDALEHDDLFIDEVDGSIVSCGIINKIQMPQYKACNWSFCADDNSVMVLHTLAVDPLFKGKGYGKKFVGFYEQYALANNCPFLRIDTNFNNSVARKMYASLGYKEIGVIPCDFNGIQNINLVCLEKKLG